MNMSGPTKRRFLLSALTCFVFDAMGAVSLAAQPEPAGSGVSVKVVVTAEAQRGSNVPVLDAKDVMVYEGKEHDRVTDWVPAQGEHAGLELFILLDDSSAQSLSTQFNDIRKFIDAQPSSTLVGIAYTRNGAAQIEQKLTNDHALAAKALRVPLGIMGVNASPYFALSDLVKHWPKSDNRREVLMVSDGIDLYYGIGDLQDPYLSTAIADAQRAGVVLSAIYSPGAGHFGHSYWQTYWGQLYLAELTDRTGGESYYIGMTGAPVAFAPYLDDLANRLNHQYVLTFLTKAEKKGGLHRVKVTTEVPNVQLVAPDQIYVPTAQ